MLIYLQRVESMNELTSTVNMQPIGRVPQKKWPLVATPTKSLRCETNTVFAGSVACTKRSLTIEWTMVITPQNHSGIRHSTSKSDTHPSAIERSWNARAGAEQTECRGLGIMSQTGNSNLTSGIDMIQNAVLRMRNAPRADALTRAIALAIIRVAELGG